MNKVYVDRNIDVRKVRASAKNAYGEVHVDFIQWPLEGKTKRIREYSLPAGEITFNDLDHVTWDELDFCTWDDFQATEKYEQILAIVGKQNREDCIHFDIAVKNGCSFYLTSDNDFLENKERLWSLSQIQIYDPEDPKDLELFLKALKDILEKKRP